MYLVRRTSLMSSCAQAWPILLFAPVTTATGMMSVIQREGDSEMVKHEGLGQEDALRYYMSSAVQLSSTELGISTNSAID